LADGACGTEDGETLQCIFFRKTGE
jgi:hypothetical protein